MKLQVLDGLIEEDEDVVDTWYLLGWLNKLRSDLERNPVHSNGNSLNNGSTDKNLQQSSDEDIIEGYLGNARFYLNKSMAVHKKHPTDDAELVSINTFLLISVDHLGGILKWSFLIK